MNLKTWVPMVAAIILGLFAAKLGKDMISKRPQAEKAPSVKFAQVVIAKDSIPPGSQLKPSDLAIGQFPLDGAPTGSYHTIEELVGRVITSPLVKQQPVLDTTLAPVGAASGLPAIVPDGMRALTIEVNETSGVAGMLVPGCRVDIITVLAGDQAGPAVAKTVARNIKLIAVGHKFGTGTGSNVGDLEGPPARSVTMEVTPKQSEMIELVCRFGNPRLVLRGIREGEHEDDTDGTTLAELRGAGMQLPGGSSPSTQPSELASASTTQPSNKPERPYREVQFIKAGVAQTMKIEIDPPQATRRANKAPVVDVQPDLAPAIPGSER